MVSIGKINTLRIVKEVDFGIYLDGGKEYCEILLPIRYVPKNVQTDDDIEVFIYFDSEDRIIATTEAPYAQVGEFAFLEVVDVNNTGAFMNWGLMKDLLLPYDEQTHRPEVGKSYVVYILQDGTTGRPIASMKIRDFLDDESLNEFKVGQEVSLMSANKTDLGYQMIINNTHVGLLHQHEVIRSIKHGEKFQGFIQNIREDRKIDVCLHLKPSEKTAEITDLILYKLKANGGFLNLHDKSDPKDIQKTFGISKGMFKKALGALYKQKKISITSDGIRLL
ncbi:CvfB family protein [Ghiorsea bivora]|uniref:CvfB family protein n=1 Tax=Ghiorsea bivora TaxID=1485545 RepID=UPI00056FB27B|nr:S1-like domain-containing RNA-binding protein [Ghiorsea bivora]